MNLELFDDLATELGFTVDTSAGNVFEAHKGDIIFHIDGNTYWSQTTLGSIKLFQFYTSATVEEFGLIQFERAVQILP